MYHNFLIHSSADGHLGCFHVLAIIVNSAAVNTGVQVSFSSKVKRQPSEWEKIIVTETTYKGLISKIYKQHLKLNSRKINDPIKKWAKELDISPKKIYRWLQTHEKMLSITHYQRNANENHNEVLSQASHNGHHLKVYKQ